MTHGKHYSMCDNVAHALCRVHRHDMLLFCLCGTLSMHDDVPGITLFFLLLLCIAYEVCDRYNDHKTIIATAYRQRSQ